MDLAKEVDFQENGIITYFEFANKMDFADDFARKEDKIGAPKPPSKTATPKTFPKTASSAQRPPKTAAPGGDTNNVSFNPADTALSVDLGVTTAEVPLGPRSQSRAGSKAGSHGGRATPLAIPPLDSKSAYQILEYERAVEQRRAELDHVAALPAGTPRRA